LAFFLSGAFFDLWGLRELSLLDDLSLLVEVDLLELLAGVEVVAFELNFERSSFQPRPGAVLANVDP
jgi:hypothetical protein